MAQHAKRLKIRRKDLRQPDEFETLTAQALSWVEDHRGIAVGVASALVALVLIMLVVGRVRASRNEAAAVAFRSAHDQFEASKYAEAADAFSELVRDYPSTPFGRLAGLYRGHALGRQGDAAGAASAYADFLAATSDDGYIRQEALTGLGRAREATSDTAGALDAYAQAAALEGPFRADARLGAARMHEAAGQAAEARAIYAEVLKDATDLDLRAFLATKVPADGGGAAKAAEAAPAEPAEPAAPVPDVR